MTLFDGNSERYQAELYADIAQWVRAMAEAKDAERSLTDTVEKDSVKQDAAFRVAGDGSQKYARTMEESSQRSKVASNSATRQIEENSIKQRLAMDSVGRSSNGMRVGLLGLALAATPLVPVLGALGGVVAALPATFGAAGLAVANFKSLGLGDIAKAAATIDTTQQKLAAGTIKQAAANKAMTNATLGLSASQKAALPLWSAWSDTMQGVAEISQKNILPALGNLGNAFTANASTIQRAMAISSGEIGRFLNNLTSFAQTPLFKAEFSTLLKSSASSLGQFLAITQSGIRSFLAIGNAAAPFVHTLGDMTLGVTRAFAAWSQSKSGQQSMQTFFSATRQSLSILGDTFKQLGRILVGIFAPAFESSKTLTKSLNDVLTKVADFLNSTRGKADVTEFWRTVATAVTALGKAIGDDLPALLAMSKVTLTLGKIFVDVFGTGTVAQIALVGLAMSKLPGAATLATGAIKLMFANPILGGLALTAGAILLIRSGMTSLKDEANDAANAMLHLNDVRLGRQSAALDVQSAQIDKTKALATSGASAVQVARTRAVVQGQASTGQIDPSALRAYNAALEQHKADAITAAQADVRLKQAQEALGQANSALNDGAKELGKQFGGLSSKADEATTKLVALSAHSVAAIPASAQKVADAWGNALVVAARGADGATAASIKTAQGVANLVKQMGHKPDDPTKDLIVNGLKAGRSISELRTQLIALGLLHPKPVVDVDNTKANAKLDATKSKLDALHSKTVTFSEILQVTSLGGGAKNPLATPPGATGMIIKGSYGADDTHIRVTGSEVVLNPRQISMVDSGWGVMDALSATGAPTIQRGGGYKAGAKPKKPPRPKLTQFAAFPEATYQARFNTADKVLKGDRKLYATYTHNLETLQKQIKHAQDKVATAKTPKTRKEYQDAATRLERQLSPRLDILYPKINFEAGIIASDTSKQQDAARILKASKAYQGRIGADEDHITQAEKDMQLASAQWSATKDPKKQALAAAAWQKAKLRRTSASSALEALLQQAKGVIKGDSPYWRTISAQLTQAQIEDLRQGDAPDANPVFDLQGLLDAGGFTRAIAAAGLTDDTGDDLAAFTSEQGFLKGLLSDPSVSGSDANFTDVANALAGVNSQIDSITKASGPTADQSAQIAQLQQQLAIQTRTAGLSDAALQTFGGSGDIGSGGYRSAFAAGGAPGAVVIHQTNNMLIPSDPAVLSAVAGAAASGFSLAPSIPSSRTAVNV